MPLNLQASDFKYLSEVDYLTLIAYRSCIFLSTNTVILSHESVCFVCLNFHAIKHYFHFSQAQRRTMVKF